MSSIFSGLLLLIVGPSGVGKGTAISLLKERHKNWIFPVSATTRPPRPNEKDGETYHFLTMEDFNKKIEDGAFLEWAWVHGKQKYGMLKSEVFEPLRNGKIVLREVDIQGFFELKKQISSKNLLSFFLLPPPWEVLEKRIQDRAPISAEELAKRKESMKKEMKGAEECDYQIQTFDEQIYRPVKYIENILHQKNWI